MKASQANLNFTQAIGELNTGPFATGTGSLTIRPPMLINMNIVEIDVADASFIFRNYKPNVFSSCLN